MKIVHIVYKCDYCGHKIDPQSVEAVVLGNIGHDDAFIPSDQVYHYHDYCLEHLLTLKFQDDGSLLALEDQGDGEAAEEELEPREDTEEAAEPEPEKKKIDLGKVGALLRNGWSAKEIADEFNIGISSAYYYIKKAKEQEG